MRNRWGFLTALVLFAGLLLLLGRAIQPEEEDESVTEGLPGAGSEPVEIIEETATHRVVRHVAGTTTVPAHPQRICALSSADELLAIGVKPVAHAIGDGNFPDYLAEPLVGVPWIPNVYGAHIPNMEAIVAVRPDLIITRSPSRQTYEQLSLIAPTVVLLDHLEFYRQRVRDVGAIVGRRAEAEARVAWYEARVRAAREILKADGDGSIAMLRVRPSSYRLHGGDHHVDPVLYGDLAVPRPALIQARSWASAASPEALLYLDAHRVIVATDVALGSRRSLDDLLGHPIWARVPAAKAGRISLIQKYRHWADSGILGRARSIDDVVEAVDPGAVEAVHARADLLLKRGGG